MTVYVALLRAVNVGGRTLPMEDVRRSLAGSGLRHVRTYLQSGNVLFAADEGGPWEHAAAIEVAIERDLGPRVAVLVLTADQLGAVVDENPLTRDRAVEERSLHATLLITGVGDDDFGRADAAAYSRVYEAAFRGLELPAAEGERAVFVGAPPLAVPVVYLELPHGYGRTRLTNAFFERRLGSGATTRSWRTLRALRAIGRTASGGTPAGDETHDGGSS